MREELRSYLDCLHDPEITRKDHLLILTLICLVEAMDKIAWRLERLERKER